MKNVLIISPYFPPSNTADMHRVRMSLPYFAENGWNAEIVVVNEKHIDLVKDELLLNNIPNNIVIHKVKALSKKFTSKFGLGSLGLRSIYFYRKYVNLLLENKKYDLIYFSTTEFSVTILGNYWKKKYNIPYLIDMQDPWHSDYYQNKPKSERPAKYWFSYKINKYLEPIAMKQVSGLISVSKSYIDDLKSRYQELKTIPHKVITFGAFEADFDIVRDNINSFSLKFLKEKDTFNLLYIGRGGADMREALTLLFSGFKIGLDKYFELFKKIRFHFIGTSYAPNGRGATSILPIAKELGVNAYVYEQTNRISFYDSIHNLLQADALVILGSNDEQYTASKIYPYLMAEKPLLAIFHPKSSAYKIINECSSWRSFSIIDSNDTEIYNYLYNWIIEQKPTITDWEKFEQYSAKNMTKEQCEFFNLIIN